MNHDIIVIGASIGGLENLSEILSGLEPGIPASFFIVQHLGIESPGNLAEILSKRTRLEVMTASDSSSIRRGAVYVAPPDRHLTLEKDCMRVFRGPRENRWRPSIDPLFRSAAVSFGSRVIGVITYGYLGDGVSGIRAIKRCGGLAIAQEPDGSDASAMPANAIANAKIDFVLPIKEIGPALERLCSTPASEHIEIPEELRKEASFMQPMNAGSKGVVGKAVNLTCPDCGGPLNEVDDGDGRSHYRCIVGHAYSEESLDSEQRLKFEQALWAAIRLLEERSILMESRAQKELAAGRHKMTTYYGEQAASSTENAELIRELMHGGRFFSN